MTTLLSIAVHQEPAATIRLCLDGELDMQSAGQYLIAAQPHIRAAEQVNTILIDLTALSFLDAAGIKALLITHYIAGRHGIQLRAINSHGTVRHILAITDVLTLLQDSRPTPN